MDCNIKKPLVSILIPCYNVEKKVYRLFDSILSQTYKHYELIVVNDGSLDNTEEVIFKYEKLYKKKGINFVYIKQENSGVARACEVGLKHVKGEYLCWPDSDDYYYPSCIYKMVSYLEQHSTCNLVRCDAEVYYENKMKTPIGTLSGHDVSRFREDNLMKDYILENKVWFAPICYMMRFHAFKKVNPNLYICNNRSGQNYQMMLPLLYKSSCGFIDECLCCYMVYKNSHSHKYDYNQSYEMRVKRIENKYECVYDTLKNMEMTSEDFSEYQSLAAQKLYAEKCLAAYDYGDKRKYFLFRKKINLDYYNNKLKLPDSIISIPIAFKLHFYMARLKQTIKNQDSLFYFIQLMKKHIFYCYNSLKSKIV